MASSIDSTSLQTLLVSSVSLRYLSATFTIQLRQSFEKMGSLKHGSTTENGKQQSNGQLHHQVPSDILMSFLAANPSIEYIRYRWLDYSAILRVWNVTKSHCLSLATSNKLIMIARCTHITLVNNIIFNGLPIGSNTV